MFDWRPLLDAPERLADRHHDGDWRRGVSNALRSKVVRIPGPRNGPLTLPRRIDDFAPLEEALAELPAWLIPAEAAAITEQRSHPPPPIFRLCEGDDAETGSAKYAFVGPFATGERVVLAIGRLR